MTASPKKRPRNAAATRDAILQSAIAAFARAGYDGVGVREIAGDAGVTAMMVNRYFGSKEKLFAEAVEAAFAPSVVVPDDSRSLAHDAAVNVVGATTPGPAYQIMLRSVSNPGALAIVRDAISRHVGRRLARQLPEPGRSLRNEMMLSVIAGIFMMRGIIASRALTQTDPERLERLVEAVFESIIETPLPGP
ncbi:TetR family transcriptional regulator [Mycobacterium sp. NPDC051804]|uniref:TetR/AcrR family transcriptional regulator n=1 Tax=Mycobacterium sp. NPDC051804 TaxID=3364295 RepID=UPI0037B69CFF